MYTRAIQRAAGVLMAILPATGLTMPPAIDGETGELHIYGSLTESPCRLEMASAWQSVTLGNTASSQLRKTGDQGQPVKVQLRLLDCHTVATRNRDNHGGNLLWSHDQPAVSVRFTAPAAPENPQLFAVLGASGIALRLTDEYGRDVRLGGRGVPLLLHPGQDILTYTLVVERTSAPLQAGAWQTLINVGMEYD